MICAWKIQLFLLLLGFPGGPLISIIITESEFCSFCAAPNQGRWMTGSREELGLPRWLSGEESTCQCRKCRFHPWVRKIPWRRNWQRTPVFLPGKLHGQRSLVGYSPWGRRVRHDSATEHALMHWQGHNWYLAYWGQESCKCPTTPRPASTTELPGPNTDSAQGEKLCLKFLHFNYLETVPIASWLIWYFSWSLYAAVFTFFFPLHPLVCLVQKLQQCKC